MDLTSIVDASVPNASTSACSWTDFVQKNNELRFTDNNTYTLRVATKYSEENPISKKEYNELVAKLSRHGMRRIGRDLFVFLAMKWFQYDKQCFIIPTDEFAVVLFKVRKYKEDSNRRSKFKFKRRTTITSGEDPFENQFFDPVLENQDCKKIELLLRKYFQIDNYAKDVIVSHPQFEALSESSSSDDLVQIIKLIKPKNAPKKDNIIIDVGSTTNMKKNAGCSGSNSSESTEDQELMLVDKEPVIRTENNTPRQYAFIQSEPSGQYLNYTNASSLNENSKLDPQKPPQELSTKPLNEMLAEILVVMSKLVGEASTPEKALCLMTGLTNLKSLSD